MFHRKEPAIYSKGQLTPKADWRTIDSSKKQTGEFVLFAFLLFTANKSNSSVHLFLGKSTARQSAFRDFLIFRKGIQPFDKQCRMGAVRGKTACI